MTLSYKDVRNAVEQKFKKATIDDMVEFVKNEKLDLGGHEQGKHFQRRTVYLQLYKDSVGISFSALSRATKLWYNVNHKTLDHNIKKTRKCLYSWGKSKVKPGNVFEWRAAVKKVSIPKSVCGTLLWIDSTDCQIERHGHALVHPNYSGKIMKVALRRMVISDGKRRIRYFSDGYTPKLYDSHWAKINKVMLVEKFGDSVFIGDGHFQKFQNETGIKCYTPILTAVGKKKSEEQLSEGQQKFNREQKALRSICEGIFGEIKTKFVALSRAWAESQHQQDFLFAIACGVHNFEL